MWTEDGEDQWLRSRPLHEVQDQLWLAVSSFPSEDFARGQHSSSYRLQVLLEQLEGLVPPPTHIKRFPEHQTEPTQLVKILLQLNTGDLDTGAG
ncbi:hypothetical protein DOTSEDRAFT_27166 [Dothistroma septosporum NZE10]|uniref:Uncharacterized protein n=1 Tax=Dothistroma septosporum (strain NZE10 / CBS 128990) TaxID=675120 RepID=N1PEI2_DOTSN|nr:hypothetical protein DOTSEDRAFT_27166 [Dothistroma septosporum NZE10]